MEQIEVKQVHGGSFSELSRIASWQRSMVWSFLLWPVLLLAASIPIPGMPSDFRWLMLALLGLVWAWFVVAIAMVNYLVYSVWTAVPLSLVAISPGTGVVWWLVTSWKILDRLRCAGVKADFWWTSEHAIRRAFKQTSATRQKPTPFAEASPPAPPPPSRDLSAPL